MTVIADVVVVAAVVAVAEAVDLDCVPEDAAAMMEVAPNAPTAAVVANFVLTSVYY